MDYYLYILKSKVKNWFYVGITTNLSKRLKEYNFGKTRSTKTYNPFDIVYTESYATKQNAEKGKFP